MNAIKDAITGAVALSLKNKADNDYIDDAGYRCCGKCHTRKEFDAPHPFVEELKIRVGVPCMCKRAEMEAQEEKKKLERFERRMDALRKDGMTDPSYLRCKFEFDDDRSASIGAVCKKYVENWTQMRDTNTGILFYGGVGTGKSFYACCIANALLEKLVPVSVTNFSRILNQLQGYESRQAVIDKLMRYDLLVIDDLGVERDTNYALEQVFNAIDSRTRSGKPLIVTTNMSMDELENAQTIAHKRIYDRVLEMCSIRLKMEGKSRRIEIADERTKAARNILI